MRRAAGFTYLEMMIAVTILGFVVVGVGQLLDTGLLDWNKSETRLEAEQNLRLALDKISRDIRLAREVSAASTNDRLELLLPENVLISYALDPLQESGPGGISGYTLVRTYVRYTDHTYQTPAAGYPKVYDIAGYLKEVRFTFYKLTGNTMEQSAPGQSELIKVGLSSDTGTGTKLELSSGIALRGKNLPRG